ncbi:recombinase family protein [Deinococcus pimensis]|uniref:recombinase family protein n=1 Tax=Deinococcus pimensis TaxID=309888 RepID=UPI0004B5182C|nr:recombinase family protein [Deinococcus pimensis]
MKIGYVRTNGPAEVPMEQTRRLIESGCEALFLELSGGEHLQRPVMHRMILGLEPGDEVTLVDPTRLSEDQPSQMAILLRRIQDRGASVRVLPVHEGNEETAG